MKRGMTNEAAKQLEKWVSGSDETLVNFRFCVNEALAEERRLLLDRLQERLYAIPTHGKSALYCRAAMDETLDVWRAESPAANSSKKPSSSGHGSAA